MSILIPSGINGTLAVPSSLDGTAKPITFAFFVKVNSFATSSTSNVEVIRTTGGTGFLASRIIQSSSTTRQLAASSNDGSFNSASLNIGADLAGVWRGCVTVFTSNSRRDLYTRISSDAGALLTAFDAGGNNTSGETGLNLLGGVWPSSDARYSHLTVYDQALSSAQADEFLLTGVVVGLTPLHRWETTSNWGAGTVIDTGSNPIGLTAPVAWSYSADTPNFNTAPNTAPVITGVNFAGFKYLITATDADGDTVNYSTSSAPSHGALTRVAGAHTYVPDGTFAGVDQFTVAGSDGISQAYSTMTVTAAGAEDTTPDPFTFGSVDNAAVSEIIYSTLPVTLSGMTSGVDVLATPSNGLQFSINGGDWNSTATNVRNGNMIEARLLSSAFGSTIVTGNLTIGGVVGSFSVTTVDVINPPVMPADTSVNVAVNSTVLGTFAASSGTTPITYTLTGSNASLFNIDSSTGLVTFKVPAIVGTGTINVVATNSAGNDAQVVNYSVIAPPVMPADTSTIIYTGASVLGTFVVLSGSGSIVYTLGGTNASLFNINSSTGLVTFKVPAVLGTGSITITATNLLGNDSQTISFSVIEYVASDIKNSGIGIRIGIGI